MKLLRKISDNISYYCWDKPKTWYYDLKWFFSNFWRFRKQLWNYRTWDFTFCNDMFIESLKGLSGCIENGNEERRSANKKVKAIKELIALLERISADDDFGLMDELTKDKDNPYEHYNEEYKRRRDETLDQIFRIIKGESKDIDVRNYDEWLMSFDGTGYDGWWD